MLMLISKESIDDFWSKVDKKGENECWNWRYKCAFSINGKQLKPHRISYMLLVGKIPNGRLLLSKCRNIKCCNPKHLYIPDITNRTCKICGTNKTRIQEGVEKWCIYNGGFICLSCYVKKWKRDRTKRRNGILNKNTNSGKGLISEMIVCKYLGTDNYNISSDNFNSQFDILDETLGKVDVKGSEVREKDDERLLKVSRSYNWNFDVKVKSSDIYFLLGYNKDRKNIIKAWKVPVGIIKHNSITISVGKKSFYDRYLLGLEEIEKLNDIYHSLSIDNCK